MWRFSDQNLFTKLCLLTNFIQKIYFFFIYLFGQVILFEYIIFLVKNHRFHFYNSISLKFLQEFRSNNLDFTSFKIANKHVLFSPFETPGPKAPHSPVQQIKPENTLQSWGFLFSEG